MHADSPCRNAALRHRSLAASLVGALLMVTTASADGPSFERDVMAVLSKAGCNMGTCHGNLNGKGGLRLSLRGQDPQQDYIELTHTLTGRRINRVEPDQSLILLKPSSAVPHEGGQRFTRESDEYRILLEWIVAGAPQPRASPPVVELQVTPRNHVLIEPEKSVQLRTMARFADGSEADVTRMATYEPSNLSAEVSRNGLVTRTSIGETTISVRYLDQQQGVSLAFLPESDNLSWHGPHPENYVDGFVFHKLERLHVTPAVAVSDQGFVRRAYLDVLGRPPTADEARRFVRDPSDEKRNLLIDTLLARPEFADHWALKWSDLLRNEEKMLDKRGVEVFHQWIRDCFADGVPLNAFVADLVSGRGSTYENPPANYYRPIRDALSRGETTARVFLGVRLQCAKCHNHPFDHWTQDDYYSWAGVFARVDYELVENKRRDKFDKHEFIGEQRVVIKPEGEVTNARTGKAAEPRFLTDSPASIDSGQDRLRQLAAWLTSPSNTAFASAQANRIWYHLMGQGIVNPVDDFRVTNPPSHPKLLAALTQDLVNHRFDVRHLIRTIMRSRTYQLASGTSASSELADVNFARTRVRRLSAEQLLDAQCQLLGQRPEFNGYAPGIRAGQLAGVQRVRLREKPASHDDRFLTVFGKPQRIMACECERSDETTLSQAFMLISGQGIQQRLSDRQSRLAEMANSHSDHGSAIGELYWSALSRGPTHQEMLACRELLTESEDTHPAWQDIAWALMNSKEFMFRH